nr:hypothetical protein [Tanacetum cinerariifolium]
MTAQLGEIVSLRNIQSNKEDPDDDVSDSYNGKDYIILFDDEDEDVSKGYYEFLQSRYDNIDLPTRNKASIPLVPDHGKVVQMTDVTIEPNFGEVGNDSDVLKMSRNFKKFDIIDDYLDHHYSAITQPSVVVAAKSKNFK